jgi:hypothetical protein
MSFILDTVDALRHEEPITFNAKRQQRAQAVSQIGD